MYSLFYLNCQLLHPADFVIFKNTYIVWNVLNPSNAYIIQKGWTSLLRRSLRSVAVHMLTDASFMAIEVYKKIIMYECFGDWVSLSVSWMGTSLLSN
jgi:hypothetical protein